MNDRVVEMIKRYPITNSNQWRFVSGYGVYAYMVPLVGEYAVRDFQRKYVGLEGIFVRHSEYDDNYNEVGYNNYNNVDPWYRLFKAYKNGNKTRYYNEYVCEPIFEHSFNTLPRAYVLTTSIEGVMVYCLDVIKGIWV
jgi:hypothetical protein